MTLSGLSLGAAELTATAIGHRMSFAGPHYFGADVLGQSSGVLAFLRRLADTSAHRHWMAETEGLLPH
jgi:hypothetical protein